MDLSGLNAAEQAHMNKVIEKKQVRSESSTNSLHVDPAHRCKTF